MNNTDIFNSLWDTVKTISYCFILVSVFTAAVYSLATVLQNGWPLNTKVMGIVLYLSISYLVWGTQRTIRKISVE